MSAEYIIGIDLGTTNSVVAYVPYGDESFEISLLEIPQTVAPGTIENRTSLPSFIYLPLKDDKGFELPWNQSPQFVIGEFARRQSADVPDRTVGGAKSWLAYHKVDRRSAILPWNAPDDVTKISPVEAATAYLQHIVAAWNHQFPNSKLADQQVVLTVPASFDASARELTREAAQEAGLPEEFVLLEEPQAALYSWLNETGNQWRKILNVGDAVLVVDVGGGTTDLTLVTVSESEGELELKRVAVGNHLLVGGDNMDLALAHLASTRFAEQGTQLDPWQSVSLWHSCRAAKELLLKEDGPETQSISVAGRGKKLIGGSVSIDLQKSEVQSLLLDGFLPECDLSEQAHKQRASGFQQLGLPYESETGITRHIAEFLSQHADGDSPVQPTDLLVNGGVFKAAELSNRLLSVLEGWFPENPPKILVGERDLDNAVARGAAYYGWTKEHQGVRIRGGTARSYYIGVETAGLAVPGLARPLNALCVVPRGMEEGTETDVPSSEIGLIVGEPAQFRFFSSAVRKEDKPGEILARWAPDELVETDSLEATLSSEESEDGYSVPVRFQSRITELGVFELWCVGVNSDQKWKLEFSVRDDES
ncbi:Hsp70 family protein [Thalassoglobus sp.]|uniref:Hsp70 family protein n=1 Tax=Thalassoglobus sp. TaxID=2795869 RepID=UPI003AA8B8CF